MVDSEIPGVEPPAPDAGQSGPPAAAGGAPSTTGPAPTNGGAEDEFELQYASEARAEQLTLITTGPSIRRGESDHIEVGLGLAESGPQSYVQGTDRLDVGGTYTEHTGGDCITQSTRMRTTVRGHLNLKGKGDTGILGGTLVDTHIGPEVLAAGMSDDLVVGVGVRTTVAGDLWLCGLMGMEEKVGIAAIDGALVELYGMSFEREYGAGLHNAGAVNFSGPTFVTQAAGFRPLLKAMTGPRNLVPGAGAPAGGASASPPPAAPAAGGGGMLADPSLATGADEIAGVEDAQDGGRILRVVADAPGDVPPARTSDTAESLGDAQRLADANEAADSGGTTEDAAEAAADFWRRVEADAEPNAADQNLIVVEGAGGERTVTVTDGSAFDDQNWADLFADQQIDYPDAQHIDQAGDGVNPPAAAAGDGAGPDGRRYRPNQPRILEDPQAFDYEKVMDYVGGGRWDRLLSDDPRNSADGHAYTVILESQDQSNIYVNDVITRLVGSEPDFYNQHNLQAAGDTRGDQYRKLRTLRDALAADPDPDSARRALEIQEAMTNIEEGVHSRMYAGLETAETVYAERPLLSDDVDRGRLSDLLADKKTAVMDEMALLNQVEDKTNVQVARMMQLSDEFTAISSAQETLSQGYDPIHYLDGMISLRIKTDGPDGAEAYKAVQADLQGLIDAMTPIRQALADADTSGIALTRFEFDAVSDPEVLEVITQNRLSLRDTHTRASTQAQYMLTDLDVAGSPRVKEALEAELASLPETPENAQRIQELNNALVTLDQRLSSPHSLSPTQVDEMMRAELSTLPDTPENAQRIQELNNALATLDERMRLIMGDALLWAEQTSTSPQNGAIDGQTAQTAWFFSQKSGTHLDAASQTGSSYDLHLSNLYDLAARDLRQGKDPSQTLQALSASTHMDPEIRRAALTVLMDMENRAIMDLALSPGVIVEGNRHGKPIGADDVGQNLPGYWNPKALSGPDLEPAQSGTKKWWKSLKGVKKRVGNVMTTIQGIHAPDRFGETWRRIMYRTTVLDGAARDRLSRQNRRMHAAALQASLDVLNPADNSQDVARQSLNLKPSQLVPDNPPAKAGAAPDNPDDAAPDPALLDDADGHAPAPDEEPIPVDPLDRTIPLHTRKQQAYLEEMRRMVTEVGDRVSDPEEAASERNIWLTLIARLSDGYDPQNAHREMRAAHAEGNGLSQADAAAYQNVEASLHRMADDPQLQHRDMKAWNQLAYEDRLALRQEAYFHMQQGTWNADQAARDVLRQLDPPISSDELQHMEFVVSMENIVKLYEAAADSGDTRKTREISALLDDLDIRLVEIMGEQEEQAKLARARANQPLSHRYNKSRVEADILELEQAAIKIVIDPEEDPMAAKLKGKRGQAWHVVLRSLQNNDIDPRRTADDFVLAGEKNRIPQEELEVYKDIQTQVNNIMERSSSWNTEAFPDQENRVAVIEILQSIQDDLKGQQDQIDVLNMDPDQAEEYRQLEFMINTYEDLINNTWEGYDPRRMIENMRRDAESVETVDELDMLRQIEGEVGDVMNTDPNLELAEGTDWAASARVNQGQDVEQGNQAAAARMQQVLDDVDRFARELAEKDLPQAKNTLERMVRDEKVANTNYFDARTLFLDKIGDARGAEDHAEAARLRVSLDKLDLYAELQFQTTWAEVDRYRYMNQKEMSEIFDSDDYINRILVYYDELRTTMNSKGYSPNDLEILEEDIWSTVLRRAESDEAYDPIATAEDLYTAARFRNQAEGANQEDEVGVYRKVLDIITNEIEPEVRPARAADVDDDVLAQRWKLSTLRPGDAAEAPAAEPAGAAQLIRDKASGSNAFLDQILSKQESDGLESLDDWVGSQTSLLDELQAADADLMAQPGVGTRTLPPGWNPPVHVENPQPTLDVSGAYWADRPPTPDVPVREKPRPGRPSPNAYDDIGGAKDPPPAAVSEKPRSGRPTPEYDDIGGAKDPPPVSEKPRPSGRPTPEYDDLGGAKDPPPVSEKPRPSGRPTPEYDDLGGAKDPPPPPVSDRPRPGRPSPNAYDIDELDGPPPAAVGDKPQSGVHHISPEDFEEEASYLPVDHEKIKRREKGQFDDLLGPEDASRPKVQGNRVSNTSFTAHPPDTPGGKWYIEVDLDKYHKTFNEFGPVWGTNSERPLHVTYPKSDATLDPSAFEVRLGHLDQTKAVVDPETNVKHVPFEVEKVLNGDLTTPGPKPELDDLVDAARARLRRRPTPPPDHRPSPGRLQANLDAVLDAVPPEQLDEVGRVAGPEAGGVFYPPPPPADLAPRDRMLPAPLPELSMREQYRDLAAAKITSDAPLGSTRGVDYVFAPSTASVVPEVPNLELSGNGRVAGVVRPTQWKKGESLPVIDLYKPDQRAIMAGAPLKVSTPDGLKPLQPGEYVVTIHSRGKTHRMVFQGPDTYDADLRRWVESIRNPRKS